ncbi:hypothetical protein AB0I81_17545 [Nonomuraea sp. NPDC050404]|uniref:hypothetical protein n=1 Tax=Nonomuraea sp. NPDC050404 TaxID=3155783 RepID=UPI0033CA1237
MNVQGLVPVAVDAEEAEHRGGNGNRVFKPAVRHGMVDDGMEIEPFGFHPGDGSLPGREVR